MLKIKIMCKP